jgi:uroporphyrinogen decarboxylase
MSNRDQCVAAWEECLTMAKPNNRHRFLNAVRCRPVSYPPVWLMRQAGRVLPEYRELRKKHSFLELVQTPELAAEVTLQPIRRFDFDAAIIFSDILVVPEAMGQPYHFRDSGGVEMDFAVQSASEIARLSTEDLTGRLQYVASAIRLVKEELNGRAALLGFAGSPWTLANFMLDGGSARQHARARALFRENRPLFDLFSEKLTAAVTEFLRLQIGAGVDAIQIFDSLGGLLPADEFEAASGRWIKQIIANVDGRTPVIVFSRGTRNWEALVETGAQAISADALASLAGLRRCLPADVAIQGNLDPGLLVHGTEETVTTETARLLEAMHGRHGFIVNLGHGVPPAARLENIQALVNAVRAG